MEGASNLCGKTWQVLVRELVGKNAKEAICVGFPGFRANRAPLPGFGKLTQRQRQRVTSNPAAPPIPAAPGGAKMLINSHSELVSES